MKIYSWPGVDVGLWLCTFTKQGSVHICFLSATRLTFLRQRRRWVGKPSRRGSVWFWLDSITSTTVREGSPRVSNSAYVYVCVCSKGRPFLECICVFMRTYVCSAWRPRVTDMLVGPSVTHTVHEKNLVCYFSPGYEAETVPLSQRSILLFIAHFWEENYYNKFKNL